MPDQADEARTMLRSLGAVLLFALLAGTPAYAQHQTQFVVQVTVPARVTLAAIEQPTHLALSEQDIARGYKDVSARYVVDQNSDRGWLLRLSPRMGLTQRVEVRGLSATLVLQADSVEVYQPQASEPQSLDLDYRFVLAPDARPGSYQLPVQLSAALL
jgi:hypothetical protein